MRQAGLNLAEASRLPRAHAGGRVTVCVFMMLGALEINGPFTAPLPSAPDNKAGTRRTSSGLKDH